MGTHRSQDVVGSATRGQCILQLQFIGQLGQATQLIVWAKSNAFHASDHAGNRLVLYLRECALAQIKEHQVGAVAQAQHLEVVLPDEEEVIDEPVVVLHQVPRD